MRERKKGKVGRKKGKKERSGRKERMMEGKYLINEGSNSEIIP